jgi:hypothetical protein
VQWRAGGKSAGAGEVARCCPAAPVTGVGEVLHARATACGAEQPSREKGRRAIESRKILGFLRVGVGNGCCIGPMRECNKICINMCISV